MKPRHVGFFFAVIAAACLIVLILFPIAWMALTSMKTNSEALSIPITWFPRNFTLRSYIDIWVGYHFTTYFFNSSVVSIAAALISTFIGAIAGYGFSRYNFRGRALLLGFFLTTQMISGTVIIGPYFKILTSLGLYNTRLGLIIAFTTIALPFCTWMTKGYFDTIPKEIDQAAKVDGCSPGRTFLSIVAPLAVPGMVSTLLFGFLLAWQDLLWSLVLIATEAKRTITVGLSFFVGQFQIDWPMLMAATLLASVPSVLAYIFLQRQLVEGLTAGAVKQ